MKFKKILLVLLISFGVLLLVLLGVGFYFYNYYVFEEVEVCLGDYEETSVECVSVEDCLAVVEDLKKEFNLTDLPDFVDGLVKDYVDENVRCDGVCMARVIEGVDSDYVEGNLSRECSGEDKTFVVDVGGKEALGIWSYFQNVEE